MLLAEHVKLRANSYSKIAEATGLSENWIIMFNHGKIKHSDVGRVETLYNFLSPVKLDI